jgi:hypothetical protein
VLTLSPYQRKIGVIEVLVEDVKIMPTFNGAVSKTVVNESVEPKSSHASFTATSRWVTKMELERFVCYKGINHRKHQ